MSLAVKKPANMRLIADGGEASWVTSDVYDVARRIQAIDPNLFIVQTRPRYGKRWLVVERVWNSERAMHEYAPVKRYENLDGRVVDDLQRMLKLPLEQRIRELDEWTQAGERVREERERERLMAAGEKAEWAARKDGLIHVPKNLPFKRIKGAKV